MGRTLVRRRCSYCGRTMGFSLWAFRGRLFTTTHGLCEPCRLHMQRRIGYPMEVAAR
jgi:hypothetical protein